MIPRTILSNCRPKHWVLCYISCPKLIKTSDPWFWIKCSAILKSHKNHASSILSISCCPLQIIDLSGQVGPGFTKLSCWSISGSPQNRDHNCQGDMEQSEINGTIGWPFHKTEIFYLSVIGGWLAALRFLGF